MSMPFYVSPEQLMKDRADFARKGIARGRSVVAIQYADGILFVSENPSQALHKVSEIYDRIAFAAVGRYNEFENLRIAGVRLADMRGYAYDRRDVTGRGLANAYAQTLGTIFSSGGEKPYEVEIFVAEIGDVAADDQLYRLTYDGQVADEHGFAVMGGAADVVAGHLKDHYARGASLEEALRVAVAALGHSETDDRVIPTDDLEVAALDRTRTQPRKFLRLRESRLTEILGDRGAEEPDAPLRRTRWPGPAPHQSGHDDPADPTDQVSGATPPLEDPVTGEPPVAPPIAPPGRPAVEPAHRPGRAGRPAAPGEPPPPAPPAAGPDADRPRRPAGSAAPRASAQVEPRPLRGRHRGDAAEASPVAHQRAELVERAHSRWWAAHGSGPVGCTLPSGPNSCHASPKPIQTGRPAGGVVPLATSLLDQAPAELELHPRPVDDDGSRAHRPQPQVVGHHPELEVLHDARLDQHGRDEVAGSHGETLTRRAARQGRPSGRRNRRPRPVAWRCRRRSSPARRPPRRRPSTLADGVRRAR